MFEILQINKHFNDFLANYIPSSSIVVLEKKKIFSLILIDNLMSICCKNKKKIK
jgi:hypothetical protein